MKPGHIALSLILISLAFLAMSFLTSCASLGSPQFCVKSDYGTFCYSLPELPPPAGK